MKKGEQTFDRLYKTLNAAQRRAVDAIEGPVMVVAGPGTGKTQILTLRIANILRNTDTAPENILALTFTEAATASMRRRLVDIIGSEAYGVSIHTFHRFCNEIIKRHPESFPKIIGAQHITDIDQAKIVERIIGEDRSLEVLKPFGNPFFYLRSILKNIQKLKQEGVDPERFLSILEEEEEKQLARDGLYHEKGPHKGKMKREHVEFLSRLKKNKELARVYEAYGKHLFSEHLYDWEDMIVEVKNVLEKDESLRRMLQEEYQYILVDEHQDTNSAQNRILELLAEFHDNPNLFVVGDEKQAIFRFQGASLENFLYFQELYPQVELVVLTDNYRSTQTILDSADSLISGKKKLVSHKTQGSPKIRARFFDTSGDEGIFLAQDILDTIRKGSRPEEIAVLYRDNGDAFPVARILEKYEVPFVIESNRNILEDREIRKLVLLLRTVSEYGSEEMLAEALHIDFLNLDPLDVFRAISGAREKHMNLFKLMRSPAVLGEFLENPSKFIDLSRKMSRWRVIAKNEDLEKIFEVVMEESGFLSNLLSLPDSAERMDILSLLFEEVRKISEAHRGASLEDFFSYINTVETHGMLLEGSPSRHAVPRVRLMTAHRAKGLEFDYVYIMGVYDGHWGNRRRRDPLPLPSKIFSLSGRDLESDENDDERRLFYVALTRARKSVTVTYSTSGPDGRERLPSQFLSEISPEHIEVGEGVVTKDRKKILSPPKPSGISVKNKEFVTELFEARGLSVTGLNHYLQCPWKYFYLNLLRIPKKKESYLMYGSAVHESLRDFFEERKKRDVSKKFLTDSFTLHLGRQPLAEGEYERFLERGIENLSGYYDANASSWNRNVLSEFEVRGVFVEDIRLTGKLDKIEILEGSRVNVVDYKTGKPKTRGYIEGSTKNSNGEIKRQLLFYRLLLDLYKEGSRFHMTCGEIDFVEPTDSGTYRRERFEILESEVEELKDAVKNAAQEIRTLAFWDRTCDEKDCEFCRLRGMMQISQDE